MSPTKTIIPSTTALRVFDAAARHLTCTGAADELFLTQSAVSKQIRTLEETLGVSLFVRVNRGLVLTDLGRIYLEEIRPLLAQLAAASARVAMRPVNPATLTLQILAIVGDRWLLPRFASFVEANPLIDVQFTSLLSRDGKDHSLIDGEFRYGDGVWPGYVADYLFGHEMVVVASPKYLQTIPALQSPADILRCHLMQHFRVTWAWDEYAAFHQVPTNEPRKITRYEFYSTILKAAVAAMGLALVPAVFVRDELARGELVNPLASGVKSRLGYYFLTAEHRQSDPAVATMRAWLLEQADDTAAESFGALKQTFNE